MKHAILFLLYCMTASVLSWSAPSAEFSSPAVAASFQSGGDMKLLPGDAERVQAILDGNNGILLAARSSSCSTSCSSGCTSSCSIRCRGGSSYTPSSPSSSGSTYRPAVWAVPSAPVVKKPEIQPNQKREIYWEDGYEWQIHNATCLPEAKAHRL